MLETGVLLVGEVATDQLREEGASTKVNTQGHYVSAV